MNTNFPPTPDQPEITQSIPLPQKSNRSLLMMVCALLLFSLMANVYFFSKLNQSNQIDQPNGQQIPVAQIETQPSTSISEVPGSETPVSSDTDHARLETIYKPHIQNNR